ncbi:MAG: DNA polymerase III subunit gamma and tau, partial [Streptosporangiaceae bacterium]
MAGDVPISGQNEAKVTPAESEQSVSRSGIPEAPLALYRRYRPSSFAEVKGQEHVTEPLRQALRSGRVHHAYLFSGPRGCGKTSSARILARSLNCEQGPTPDPCGVCASCVALAPSGPGSIDVIEIDAASHGGIDDARDLRERAFYSPVSARYKIYIIDEAHMVTGGGFNALLKLVEEPPPHLKFVFATTEPDKVIPTIRSRTHHYPFRLLPPAVLRELLEEILSAEQIPYEPSVLPVVIRAGAGSARDALSVVDQLIAGSDASGLRYDRAIALLGYTDDALLDEMAEAFAAGDGAAVFRTIDRVVEAGHDPRRFAMDLLDRLRDLIVLAAVPDAGASGLLDLPEDRLERMSAQAAGFGQARLVHAAETVSSGLVEMRGATSPRLLLELMCAQVLLPPPDRVAGIRQASPARQGSAGSDDLLARVERLERWARAAVIPAAGAQAAGAQAAGAQAAGAQAADAPSLPGRAAPATRPDAPSEPDRPLAAPSRPEPQPQGGGRPAGDQPSRGRQPGPPPASPERQPPPTRPAAATHTSTAPSALDTATLLERWPDVLDAVRQIRKTPWILLTNYASVESMEDTVLTLSFDTEGNAKGFGTSGSDNDLADAMEAMFGIRPTIRTIASPAGGRGARTRARGRGDGDQWSGPARAGAHGEPA